MQELDFNQFPLVFCMSKQTNNQVKQNLSKYVQNKKNIPLSQSFIRSPSSNPYLF